MEGTPFGRYRLVELLGRGGMGEVWRAYDTGINRVVALKMLPMGFADDQVFQERFRREAQAAAGLDEPHVVPIHDFGEIDGRLYVTMRLIKGRDLQHLLDDGPLPPGRAVKIIEQIASALHAAHEVGLVHRDVKPSNILVTDDDFAYLIDFGIARAAGETGLTSTGATVGTWAYMAPERFQSGTADARADIYSLACVLHQSLTGQVPFPVRSLEQIAVAHMLQPPPQPSALQRGVPAALDAVIATGMAKDPDQRYPTTKDLALAARAALMGTREPTPHPTPGNVPSHHAPEVPINPAADTRTQAGPTVSPSHAPTQQAPISASDDRILIPRLDASARPPVQEAGSQRLNRRSMLLLGVVAILIVVTVAVVVISIGSRSSPGGGGEVVGVAGPVTIGVKFDQPGLSVKNPDGSLSGFDVDVAKYVAEQLGYKPDEIMWKEAPSAQRETLIQNGQVEYIVATYSITPERKEKVGFAGPYFQTGQSLLVRADNTDITGPESLTGNKRVCSVVGSTPAQRIKDKYPDVQLQLFDTYWACVEALRNGAVEAATTDAVILAGYAAQYPGTMKVVGQPFSTELWGIGVAKDNTELRNKINDALQKMEDSGAWKAAFDKNLGASGYQPPPPPPINRY